jgi:pseudaminic acid synthase
MTENSKVYIIAELSANHNNNFELAVETIKAIAKTGADAVKVQTYKPESLTLNLDTGFFAAKTEGLWEGYTPYKLFSEASMPYEWQPKLKKIANDLGLEFFSSPFDKEGVDFLESINVPMYKIASLEITDIPLIKYVASKQKPIIISTGVAEIEDIENAIEACHSVGNRDITFLKCTTQYPAPIDRANVLTMPDIGRRFNVKVGLSDHTMGSMVPIVAASLGAKVIEKHFILDRSLGGADSAFSMEPHEFSEMVESVRKVELILGEVTYKVTSEEKSKRRSLFVISDINKGELITEDNVKPIRPGAGLHPKYYESVIGKPAIRNYKKGEPFLLDSIV